MNPITVVTKPPTTEVTEGPTEKTGNCTIIEALLLNIYIVVKYGVS
ncbi:9832_t:CDS:2 [Rhizophagus irregularis]|nr:9832_t:CDS:2 [Rhizophagus irregularis]